VKTLNLTITAIDTNITLSGNTLSSNATNASYQWIDCAKNFIPIVGETNQTFIPNSNGSYAVVVTNGSCTDSSSCFSFNTLSLDNLNNNNFIIFPNPSNGDLYIQTDKQLTLRLYNSVGQLILIEKINEVQAINAVNLNKLSKGFYLYELSNNLHIETRGKLLLK
jgi:hypothetical protein